MVTNLGDVGGWFRTATGVATPAWGPGEGGFGRVSPDADLAAALAQPVSPTIAAATPCRAPP